MVDAGVLFDNDVDGLEGLGEILGEDEFNEVVGLGEGKRGKGRGFGGLCVVVISGYILLCLLDRYLQGVIQRTQLLFYRLLNRR